jgi:trigger factor
MQKTITTLPKSQVSIDVSVPHEQFQTYREKAIARLGENLELPGFRKGKVPQNMLEKSLPEMAVMEEMANIAINDHFPKIIMEEKIDAIGRPEIKITKVAPGNPFEFTATVAVVPEVTLPDYKKIASGTVLEKEATVTDEELDTAIIELKKTRAHQDLHKNDNEEAVNHDHAELDAIDASLTDEYVKDLGPFGSVADFKEKYKENILKEKGNQIREKRRIAILEAILEKTNVEMPDVLVQSELEQLMGRLKSDVANIGVEFDEYLKHISKTEDALRAEFLPDAEKRAKMELAMHKIGLAEKIEPAAEEIEAETMRLMTMYKDADENRARVYVTHLLANEAIFRFLEEQN